MTIDVRAPRSRRSLLAAVGAAVAGAATATLARTQAVLGAGDDAQTIHVGDSKRDVRSTTYLYNGRNDHDVLYLSSLHSRALIAYSQENTAIQTNSFSEPGLIASSVASAGIIAIASAAHRAGAVGYSEAGSGVMGSSGSVPYGLAIALSDTGVYGLAPSGCGVYGKGGTSGVRGVGLGTATGVRAVGDGGYGVYGSSASAIGVRGTSSSQSLPAVQGWSTAGNTGVQGFCGPKQPSASPANVGVYGVAPTGRGVVAEGGKAQLRLVPSSAASHPKTGAVGDLFLDNTARLWLCIRTGKPATWKQVSLV